MPNQPPVGDAQHQSVAQPSSLPLHPSNSRPKRKNYGEESKSLFYPYKNASGNDKARCNYCGANYACNSTKNGSTGMSRHLDRWKNKPENSIMVENHSIDEYC